MDSVTIFVFGLVFIIILLSFLFRKQLADLDRNLAEKLKKIAIKKGELDQGVFETSLPYAQYHVRTFAPHSDLTGTEINFVCASSSLKEAIEGIAVLKQMAEEPNKEQKNNNYTGIG